MDIVESSKRLGSELGEIVEEGIEKGKEVLSNVASHLPFANLAKDKQDTYTIEVDLPGVKKEDIDISLKEHHLSISGVRQTKKEVKEEDYYLRESFYGKIERSFLLPNDLNTEDIDARYEDGRLSITLHKAEASKGRSITVK